MYDIIGDVHGEADKLKELLLAMDYKLQNGVFTHNQRKAVFVGDFINRGPKIRETLQIVRSMVEKGSALAILGNHELYAIFYQLKDIEGKFYKKRNKYRLAINQTLDEFKAYPDEWKSHLKWMRTLPLFLELNGIRVVHACWNDANIEILKSTFTEGKLKKSILRQIAVNNSPLARSFWETTKGIDFELPKDLLIYDNTGTPHRTFRMKWWENHHSKTFKDISLESRFSLPDYTIPHEIIQHRELYPAKAPLVFFGHYCLKQCCSILTKNLCCVDSCVTRTGKLVAYRWNGEKSPIRENFFSFDKSPQLIDKKEIKNQKKEK
jgi:diadenosine tetraphosphatase ApaH/serine/threonine PP2A family protein phosphatase